MVIGGQMNNQTVEEHLMYLLLVILKQKICYYAPVFCTKTV